MITFLVLAFLFAIIALGVWAVYNVDSDAAVDAATMVAVAAVMSAWDD